MRTDLLKQEIPHFIGVNLRQDRMDLADEELAKAINADMHAFLGSIYVRLGRSKQFSTALSNPNLRRIGKVNGSRYQIADRRVYRNQSLIGTLSGAGNDISCIVPFRPLNDSTIWAFISDTGQMVKHDGSSVGVTNWGIVAPASAPSVAASSTGLTGLYSVVYTYARLTSDGALAHESSPSPISGAVTLANQGIAITGIVPSTDPQVTHTRIYRTVAGGASYLFDQSITAPTTSVTTTTADSALGTEVEDDNDPPPECSWAALHNETMFLCGDPENPHYLWHSKRFHPEAVTEFVELGNADDPLQCAVPTAGVLGAFARGNKYRVLGNGTQGYVGIECLGKRGTPSPLAAVSTEFGIVFVSKDGVYSTNLLAPDLPIADDILPLFYGESVNDLSALNWTYASQFSAVAYKNRYYLGYVSGTNTAPDMVAVYSRDTKKWYFFEFPTKSFYVEEDIDSLVAGSNDGYVYTLESGNDDDDASISMDVQTKDYHGENSQQKKLFLYAKVDAYVPSGTLTASFHVDGTFKKAHTITGDRTNINLRLPEKCIGRRWRMRLQYTGTGRAAVFGVSAMWLALGSA